MNHRKHAICQSSDDLGASLYPLQDPRLYFLLVMRSFNAVKHMNVEEFRMCTNGVDLPEPRWSKRMIWCGKLLFLRQIQAVEYEPGTSQGWNTLDLSRSFLLRDHLCWEVLIMVVALHVFKRWCYHARTGLVIRQTRVRFRCNITN